MLINTILLISFYLIAIIQIIGNYMKDNQYNDMSEERLRYKLLDSCIFKKFEVVKYLMTDISDRVSFSKDEVLIALCDGDFIEAVRFLIIDCDMYISIELKDWLEGHTDDTFQYALKLIETRDLAEKMSQDLVVNDKRITKVKL